ncbi:MAG: hypothetical protein NTZ56_20830 [Acidobacteria bacterium]|nr:hypothetical protein [Acidobacteriota bacterium]
MRILLDESVPHKLRLLIDGHTVVTTGFQGWSGFKNGNLLAVADEAGFDLFLTADQELRYQQNLTRRRLAVIVLSSNNWSVIRMHHQLILAAILTATPGSYQEVELPFQ